MILVDDEKSEVLEGEGGENVLTHSNSTTVLYSKT